MEHDIIYKPPPGIFTTGDRAHESLRRKFRLVMKEHITKANHDFDKIYTEFQGQIDRAILDYSWELDPWIQPDWDEKEENFLKIVNSITDENLPFWQSQILNIAQDHKYHAGFLDVENTPDKVLPDKYGYLRRLVRILGEQKSPIALSWLTENEISLRPFLVDIIYGVWKSSPENKAKAEKMLAQWIDEGNYLLECAYQFDDVLEIAGTSSFKKIFGKIIAMGDIRALVFLLWNRDRIFSKILSENDFDAILELLVLIPLHNYQFHDILVSIAELYPLKIIRFFHKRIGFEINERKKDGKGYISLDNWQQHYEKLYKAIETGMFFYSYKVLRQYEEIIVPAICEWFDEGGDKDKWLYHHAARRFFEMIFKNLSVKFKEQVIFILINNNGIHAIDNIFQHLYYYKLANYPLRKESRKFWGVWKLCTVIIKKYFSNRDYMEIKNHLFELLSRTGVEWYSIPENHKTAVHKKKELSAYQKKRKELKLWPDYNDPEFKNFIQEYGAYLKKITMSSRDIEL